VIIDLFMENLEEFLVIRDRYQDVSEEDLLEALLTQDPKKELV